MPWKKGNRVRLLAETQAEGGVQEIYEQLKNALGLPHVPAFYQATAVYPKFLELHWRAFRPVFARYDFFEVAERLRADAYTRAFNYFLIPDLSAVSDSGTHHSLEQTTELLLYEDTAMLLAAILQLQAFDGPAGAAELPEETMLPVKHPIFHDAPALPDENSAPLSLRRAYEELRRALGTSFISYEYRVLARQPEFFVRYWPALKEWAASPIYEVMWHAIRETAWLLAREVRAPGDLTVSHLLEAGLGDDELAAVIHVSELFVGELSALALNLALARIALEGGTQKRPAPAGEDAGTEQAA